MCLALSTLRLRAENIPPVLLRRDCRQRESLVARDFTMRFLATRRGEILLIE